jgi:putative ABC transport system permease protein
MAYFYYRALGNAQLASMHLTDRLEPPHDLLLHEEGIRRAVESSRGVHLVKLEDQVVEDDVQVLLGLAVLFLLVCLLNTIGLLLAKIMRRSGDIGLRRALGASRRAIFSQYIVEAGLIGIAGGIAGIGMTMLGLQGIKLLYGEFEFVERLVRLDWLMISTAIVLAVISALAAALYPTWRACGIHPASQLKSL